MWSLVSGLEISCAPVVVVATVVFYPEEIWIQAYN